MVGDLEKGEGEDRERRLLRFSLKEVKYVDN